MAAALNNDDEAPHIAFPEDYESIKRGDVFDVYPICVPYYIIELWGDEVGNEGFEANVMIREFGYSYAVNDREEENDILAKLNEIVGDIKHRHSVQGGYYGWITEEEEEGNYTNFKIRMMLYDAEGEVDKCMWEQYVSDILDPPPPPKSAGKKK